ncbi:recombinase family protein [Streptomyces sp. NPDC059278]|uniref:recombinase family protein n=1 Tax=Streptomyces sp. NPDC059278 TaxID=3346801 RepID=UPI003694C52C
MLPSLDPLRTQPPGPHQHGRRAADCGIFTSLHENLDTTTPGGRLVFHVFAALEEFSRELIVIAC